MPPAGPPVRAASAGFTLVELAVVLALAALLAGATLPAYRAQVAKSRRADAVTALTRVQWAQEQYRAHHGLYAGQLAALRGAGSADSAEGFYRIELRAVGPTGYVAAAVARADRGQAADRDCPELTVAVHDSFASFGPAARCWIR
jgi:type IV pilus assembly protein PilE